MKLHVMLHRCLAQSMENKLYSYLLILPEAHETVLDRRLSAVTQPPADSRVAPTVDIKDNEVSGISG